MEELSQKVKTTQELTARGISHSRIRNYCSQGIYAKIDRNSYCLTQDWQELNPEQQLMVRHYAFSKNHPQYVLSHLSAALFWGAPLLNPPSSIWASVPSPHIRARTSRHRIFSNRSEECQTARFHQGLYLTDPLQTAVDCARALPLLDALCIVDYLLYTGLCSLGALEEQLLKLRGRGCARARLVAQRMSEKSASAAETIARNLMIDWNFPLPEQQVSLKVRGRTYRPDFLWEEYKLILEVDGAIKYTGNYGDPLGVIQEEHLRQRQLEQSGYTVLRVRWDDLVRRPENLKALLLGKGLKPLR